MPAVHERDPRQLAAWAAAAVLLALGAVWYVTRTHHSARSGAAAPAVAVAREHEAGRLVVDVAGAVRRPGVYRVRAGARVEDALRRAGGPTRRADLSQINRAAKLEDGRQVLVPIRPPRTGAAVLPGAVSTPAVPLNLNTATLEQLDTLDGVGPATAQKILDYRTTHGGFGSVEDLGEIPGIGEKRLAALRDKVRV